MAAKVQIACSDGARTLSKAVALRSTLLKTLVEAQGTAGDVIQLPEFAGHGGLTFVRICVVLMHPEDVKGCASVIPLKELLDYAALAEFLGCTDARGAFIRELCQLLAGKTYDEMTRMLKSARVPLLSDKERAMCELMRLLSGACKFDAEVLRDWYLSALKLGSEAIRRAANADASYPHELAKDVKQICHTALSRLAARIPWRKYLAKSQDEQFVAGDCEQAIFDNEHDESRAANILERFAQQSAAVNTEIQELIADIDARGAVDDRAVEAAMNSACAHELAKSQIDEVYTKNFYSSKVPAAHLVETMTARPAPAKFKQELEGLIRANRLAVRHFERQLEKFRAANAGIARQVNWIKRCSGEVVKHVSGAHAGMAHKFLNDLAEAARTNTYPPETARILESILAAFEGENDSDAKVRTVHELSARTSYSTFDFNLILVRGFRKMQLEPRMQTIMAQLSESFD